LAEKGLIPIVLRVVAWLYSMPNPQVETYFRDLRDVQERVVGDDTGDYVYKRRELPAARTTVGGSTTATQLHPRT